MRPFLTVIKVTALAGVLAGCGGKEVPVEQRVADCTNSTVRFHMTVQHFPRYEFVLGMPSSATGGLSFRGEIVLGQGNRTLARIPIGSQNMTPCNWLPGLSGCILTSALK